MSDSDVIIQIRGDVADINAKLSDLKGYIGKVKDETKSMGEQGKTSWQMMAAGCASVVYLFNQAEEAIKKLAAPILSNAQAFGENEQAVLRLTGVLAAHGIASQDVVKAYSDMASEFQAVTKYSDEQIMSVQEVLTNWGVAPSKMKEAVETTISLAIRTGDLNSAAEMLGQAFDGNTRRLGRLLPGIKGLEAGSLSAGGAMKMIRDQIGDTAQKEAEGYLTKVKKMDNAWDDFKETLGQYVVPALKSLINESINGIHALERLFGVNTLAWKQKELQLVEERIKAAQKGAAPDVGGEFTQQEDDLYALYVQRNKLRADIAAEDTKNQKALEDADDKFIKTRSAQGDKLEKKWAETRSKLVQETETADLDEHTKKIGDIIAQAEKLRSEFKLVAGAESTITAWETAQIKEQNTQDLIAAGKYLDAEKERLRKIQASQYDDSHAIRLIAAENQLTEATQKRAVFAISEAEYLQEELSIKQELIKIGQDRIAQGEQPAAQLDTSLTTIRKLKNEIVGINVSLNKTTWLGGATSSLNEFADKAKNTGKLVGDAVTRIFDNMTDALTEFVMTGKTSFTDFANSVIKDLIRIYIQQQITGPLASASSSLLGSLFSSDSGTTSTSSQTAANTSSISFSEGMSFTPIYHTGGNVGGPYRLAFNTDLIPRRHTGGLAPDERLVINKVNERYVSEEQNEWLTGVARAMQSSGTQPGNVSVSIKNESGQAMKVTDSKASYNNMRELIIEVVIDAHERNAYGLRDRLGG